MGTQTQHARPIKFKPARTLRRVTGATRGRDVALLQGHLRTLHPHLSTLKVDGVAGPRFWSAVAFAKRYVFGYHRKDLTTRKLHVLAGAGQLFIQGVRVPSPYMRYRAKVRQAALAKAQAANPGKRAADFAEQLAGLTEKPPGSNIQPRVQALAKAYGCPAWVVAMGYPWCALLVWLAYGVAAKSKTAAAGIIRFAFNGLYTVDMYVKAHAAQFGMTLMGKSEIRRGHVLLFDFVNGGDIVEHTGIALRPPFMEGGVWMVESVDGNTSFQTGGDEANGGAVAVRVRPLSTVRAVIAVADY